jgi:coatomer subunit beta
LEIKSHLVIRVALWIIGEYAETKEEIQQAFQTIKKNIGSLPIFPLVTEDLEIPAQQSEEAKEPKVITKTIVLPDGSYGTQTIVVDD